MARRRITYLSRVDVTGGPPDRGSKGNKCFHQHLREKKHTNRSMVSDIITIDVERKLQNDDDNDAWIFWKTWE